MKLEQPLQRILLIDDNPDDRLLAIRELNREFPQAQIEEVLDFTALMQALENNQFELAITDYDLQWTTGLDVLRLIKIHDPNRPVVMFTNSGTQEVAVEAMKTGLDDYVIKSPKHFVRLTQAVNSVWVKAQTQQRAERLQFQLQFLLNELEVGVFRATLEGQLIEVSDGFLKLLGLTSLEDAQCFFEAQPAFGRPDRSKRSRWEREVMLTCLNQKTIWIQINEAIVNQNGDLLLDGLIRDITEKKQTAAALQELNQTLERRVSERTARLELLNRELESFAFSVSHDLRSPIRQIDGFISLIRQHLEASSLLTDETTQRYLNRLVELTDRSGRMIDDLLQFSRTGRAEMHYTSVNMDRLVQEVQVQLEPQITRKSIRWQLESLPKVQGDRNLLRQVWQNLLENAVKYSSKREQAEIEIGSSTQDTEIIFFVRDNGIGFDMQSANQLFGIFQRLYNAAEFEGTGIGLANVQRIIYRHGGRVWAEGIPDQGATFYFSIPSNDGEPISNSNS